jgi:hypothetical protein
MPGFKRRTRTPCGEDVHQPRMTSTLGDDLFDPFSLRKSFFRILGKR